MVSFNNYVFRQTNKNVNRNQLHKQHNNFKDISLIGETFGLDGIEAANDDRFLSNSLGIIRDVHHGRSLSGDGFGDEPLKRFLLDE